MDQSLLKTSWKQRVIYIIVLIVMVFVFIMSYAGIVMSGNNKSDTASDEQNPELAAIEAEYTEKQSELDAYATANLSGKYFDTLKEYRSRVKAYNSATAGSGGLKTEDLLEGSGRELAEGDGDYIAYYIGWCADESVFDSSFDDFSNPTTLKSPLSGSLGLIEGWTSGVVGMKLGGIRELTIPGELAYGETQEICGGTNSPLKFVIYAFEDEGYNKINAELKEIENKYMEAYYKSAGTMIEGDSADSAGDAEVEVVSE